VVQPALLAVALAGGVDQRQVARRALPAFGLRRQEALLQRHRHALGKADADKAAGGHGVAVVDQAHRLGGGGDLVKPQLSSVVTAVHVKEGQFVAKGQPLFTLDGRADAANLARVEAQLLKDQATLADAQRQLARAQELLSKSFVSQGAVDTAQANVDAQRAAVAADRAAIEAARVQVSYSRIVAPASGRVGQINVFAGSTVSPGGAAMVSITQLDPIAVSFNLPQRNLPDALKALAEAGSGMNLSELFIRRPVMTVLLNLAIVPRASSPTRSIPVAALPSYDTPVINVFASLPGASPENDGHLGGAAAGKAVPDHPGREVISSPARWATPA
jgi:multidrug efflux pump subunit AcrA (membrane-fusion protein)